MMTLHKQAMNQFEIKSKDSLIYVDNKRNVLVSMSAFGELRKDLINNIGLERMKGFLIRYGWDLGQQDGKKIKSKIALTAPAEFCTGAAMDNSI